MSQAPKSTIEMNIPLASISPVVNYYTFANSFIPLNIFHLDNKLFKGETSKQAQWDSIMQSYLGRDIENFCISLLELNQRSWYDDYFSVSINAKIGT